MLLIEYSPQNIYRPFCSERCKMLDLGQWANESYRIPDQSNSPASFDE
ncbi:DNA gyrase inhibitor YacG [Chitinibacter sp. S2-10]